MTLNQGVGLGNFNKPVLKLPSSKLDQIDLSRSTKPQPQANNTPKIVPKPWERKPKVDTGFKSVDLGNARPAKLGVNDINFRKNFKIGHGFNDAGARNRIINGLKGTLNSYEDRRKVANLFYDKRGGGGTSRDEMKYGLRKLGLADHQIRAVRKKFGI